LREWRIDPGERDDPTRNCDARGTDFRVETVGRFDRTADALDLIEPNRFLDQSFAMPYGVGFLFARDDENETVSET
jgi:hypothetical protein